MRIIKTGIAVALFVVLTLVLGCGTPHHPLADLLSRNGAPDCREHIVTFQAENPYGPPSDVELYVPQRTVLFRDLSPADGLEEAYLCRGSLQKSEIHFVIDAGSYRYPVPANGGRFSQHTKRVRLTVNGRFSTFSVWNHRGKLFQ